MDPHRFGRRAEELAARHLEESGWRILARNYRSGHKEVDIVARRARIVAFVEVKGRSGGDYGHPLEAITWRKRREVTAVARAWIREHPAEGVLYRFDAVSVIREAGGRVDIEYVEGAWRVGE